MGTPSSPSSPPSTPPQAAAARPATPASPPAPPSATPPGAPRSAPAPPAVPRRGEVRDAGAARHPSIHAHRWTTRGAVKVDGEVDADEVRLSGPTTIGGAVSAGALRSEGALELTGAAEVAGNLSSDGSLRSRAAVHAGDAELRGAVHLVGELRVDRGLAVTGSLIASGVRAGLFTLDGTAQVPGDVEAHRVELRFRDRSRLGTIRAEAVHLAVRPPNPIELVLGRHLAVKVLRVEARSVELEGVDVQFVRSPEIVLGREAHVTEYEGKIVRRHPSARVGPESRSPPPYGLSR